MMRLMPLVLLLALPAHGADLRAVGLLGLGGDAGCTATLVAPDVAITAAHCLTAPTGGMRDPATLTFHPATAGGEIGPAFVVAATAVHPVSKLPGIPVMRRVARDVGVLRLAAPVPADLAEPLPVQVRRGDEARFWLVSFRGPEGGAQRARACDPGRELEGVPALACKVVRGESGGAVIAGDTGSTRLLGVVVASAARDGQDIAYYSEVYPLMGGLLGLLGKADE